LLQRKKTRENRDVMVVHYDSIIDALDIRLLPGAEVARSVDIDDRRVVDLDAEGRVVSIEIMGSSHGFEITDIIERYGLSEHQDGLLKLASGKLPTAVTKRAS
jgi:uncharacterized protein YuzE